MCRPFSLTVREEVERRSIEDNAPIEEFEIVMDVTMIQ